MGTYIQTVTGLKFDFLYPDPESVHPIDIAWALSGINRFTGHTRPFYTVAQHCVRVSNMAPKHLALQGLLHDAAEAYIGDISTPLKNTLDAISGGKFRAFERNIEDVVSNALGMPTGSMDKELKRLDFLDFEIARQTLIPGNTETPELDISEYPPIKVMKPEEAFAEFVIRWAELDQSKAKVLFHALRRFRSGGAYMLRRRDNHT